MRLIEILNQTPFLISAEIVTPLNGVQIEDEVLPLARELKGYVHLISVTEGARGSLRGGTTELTHKIKEEVDIETIRHLTCRDHDRQQVENVCSGLTILEIENILAMKGDPKRGLNISEKLRYDLTLRLGSHHRHAYQLVHQLSDMNKGRYLQRTGISEEESQRRKPTNFCVGVVADPKYHLFNTPNYLDRQVYFLRIKQDSGAEFVVTQMVPDAESLLKYIKSARSKGITMPFLGGIYLPFNYKNAMWFQRELSINFSYLNEIEKLSEEQQQKTIFNRTSEIGIGLKKSGEISGIHIFTSNKLKRISQITELIETIQQA